MSKDKNIYIRLEICKDKNTGSLMLQTRFDPNAPNVTLEKDAYFWYPTREEQQFLNEAFDLIPPHTPASVSPKKPSSKTEKKTPAKQTPDPDNVPHPPLPPSPFDHTQHATTSQPKSTTNDTTYPPPFTPRIEKPPSCQTIIIPPKDEDDNIYHQADNKAIDAALKRRLKHDNQEKAEADEPNIIEKVLKQKKKGKWSFK